MSAPQHCSAPPCICCVCSLRDGVEFGHAFTAEDECCVGCHEEMADEAWPGHRCGPTSPDAPARPPLIAICQTCAVTLTDDNVGCRECDTCDEHMPRTCWECVELRRADSAERAWRAGREAS